MGGRLMSEQNKQPIRQCACERADGARCTHPGKVLTTRNGIRGWICTTHACNYINQPIRVWRDEEIVDQQTFVVHRILTSRHLPRGAFLAALKELRNADLSIEKTIELIQELNREQNA